MSNFNEKCTIEKYVQVRDDFGSITQSIEVVGDFWCHILDSDGYFRGVKGGKKRIQTIEISMWINTQISHENLVLYNNIRYSVVNAIHNRTTGITTIKAEFNN